MQTCPNSPTFVVMNSMSLHIEYLLTQHDCVVVPGWGALVVQHSHALFNADNTIIPPRRWLSFNPLLTHNDALLAHSIMRAEQCSYEEAIAHINKQVALWHNTLQQGGSVTIEHIGSFTSQDNGAIIFTEATSTIVNKSLTLLPSIAMPLLSDLLPLDTEEERIETTIEQPVKITWYRRTAQAVASIAAIVILMLFISTPVDNFQPSNDYAALVAAEILTSNDSATPDTDTPALSEEAVTEVVPDEPVEVATDMVSTPSHYDTPATGATVGETPRYILVIGSLPSRTLAEKQIAEFATQGVTEHINIYESDGRYRLYIEGYNTMQQAQSRLDEITAQSQLPVNGIWICSTR